VHGLACGHSNTTRDLPSAVSTIYTLALLSFAATETSMATLTVRNLDEAVARRLRIRAAENGRSTEAEHREILRSALAEGEPPLTRQQAAARLAAFRRRNAGRGSPAVADLLEESRAARSDALTHKRADG
jgi:plasmid stability protein